MKRFTGMLILVAFVLSIAVAASARTAPTNQKAFTSNAAVQVVSPIVTTASVMIGYDVIENISTETRDLSIAQNTLKVDTSTQMELSPTRAWRSIKSSRLRMTRQRTRIVLLT